MKEQRVVLNLKHSEAERYIQDLELYIDFKEVDKNCILKVAYNRMKKTVAKQKAAKKITSIGDIR